ncbi:MAG: FAD-dependent oxidoreductase, partial [Nitrososphaerales archaeon]
MTGQAEHHHPKGPQTSFAPVGDNVVVVGAGMSGICAAAALRRTGADVTLLERDTLGDCSTTRRGVPHSGQLHNLLEAGQRSLEDLLPGYLAELATAGAVRASVASDTHVFEMGQRMPERDLGMSIVAAPRALIELVARRLLLRDGGIRVFDSTSVVGVRIGDSALELVVSNGRGGTDEQGADLVVDASGSSSAFPRWLREVGYPLRSEVEEVKSWYVTARFRGPIAETTRPKFWMVFPTAPRSRGGLVSPIGARRFNVSLNGVAVDDPPRSLDQFHRYARSLEDPAIAELLEQSEPLSEPTVFRRPVATWNHYEELTGSQLRLIPLGDSFVTLNPLFGQGISVAAGQAAALASVAQGGVSDVAD